VYIKWGQLILANSIFTDNFAGQYGGALQLYGDATIYNNTFVRCNSLVFGGAISTSSGVFNISSNNFRDCSSMWAGAVYVGGAFHSYSTSNTYTNNTATCSRNTNLGAGALYVQNSRLYSQNDVYNNNRANCGGGAVGIIGEFGGSILVGGVFNNNSATYNGGAILSSVDTTILSSSFTFNNASADGGSIFRKFSAKLCWLNNNRRGNLCRR
jgi:predicted outer membrane repeat protein